MPSEPLSYISTRGDSPPVRFEEVLRSGTAPDGGLYMPSYWPQIAPEALEAFALRPYPESAAEILRCFIAEDSPLYPRLPELTRRAYKHFSHSAIVPLRQTGQGRWLLELFHGPSLAFKDLALQMLASLLDALLEEESGHISLLAATSGDTGAAAIEAFGGHSRITLFVLFPEGRISELQRRQMTCSGHENVFPLSVKGSFDDCQRIVKTLFADKKFSRDMALGGVNSLNWARLAAQIPYYFTAAVALGDSAWPVNFIVPTGNFGNVFAAYAAKQMGAPIGNLVIATNANKVLPQALTTSLYRPGETIPTSAPAMDIQAPSNFERLLFEAMGRDAAQLSGLMNHLAQTGEAEIPQPALSFIRERFSATSADETAIAQNIAQQFKANGLVLDPHSAAGMAAMPEGEITAPHILLATAHAGKFPESVAKACGETPTHPTLATLAAREEHFTAIENDASAVRAFMMEKR